MGVGKSTPSLVFLFSLFVSYSGYAADAGTHKPIGPGCGESDRLPQATIYILYPACALDKLSWVEIQFWNDQTKDSIDSNKPELESLVRATARRLLPDLEHEVLDPNKNIVDLYGERDSNPEYLRRRAHLMCEVGALADSVRYSFVAKCFLSSYSHVVENRNAEFSSSIMGMGPRNELDETVKDSIRTLIQELSDQIYRQISSAEQQLSKSIDE